MNGQDLQFTTISTLDGFPETARLLGNLTVSWSHAERILYLAFWVASEATQQKAFEIFESMPNFRARYDLAVTLLKQNETDHPKFPELIERLQTLIQCFQIRNELSHRTWVKSLDGTLALLDHRLNKKAPKLRKIADTEISDTIRLINENCDKIVVAIMQIFPASFKQS